jgi:hypothetical protein
MAGEADDEQPRRPGDGYGGDKDEDRRSSTAPYASWTIAFIVFSMRDRLELATSPALPPATRRLM